MYIVDLKIKIFMKKNTWRLYGLVKTRPTQHNLQSTDISSYFRQKFAQY